MLSTLIICSLGISEKYNSVAQKALSYAKRSLLDIDSKEDSKEPGTYQFNNGYIHISSILTSPTTKDVRGYAIDGSILAIAPSNRRSIKEFNFQNSTVFVDTEKQELYHIKETLDQDKEVMIFNAEKVEALSVFTNFHFDISTREFIHKFDKTDINNKKFKIDGNIGYSQKWNHEEGQDPYYDGRPEGQRLFEGVPLEAGVGGVVGLQIEATVDYSVLKEFFIDAKFTFKAATGFLFQYVSENTVPDPKDKNETAEHDEGEKDEGLDLISPIKQKFQTSFGFSFCGFSFGFFPGISFRLGIEEIKFKIGNDLKFYRGMYMALSKSVTLSKNGIKQSNWEFNFQKIREDPDLKQLKDINFYKQLSLTFTPYLRVGIFVSLEAGTKELASLEVYAKPKIPVELSFNDNKCAFPYVFGSINFGIDVGLEFSGFKVGSFTIIPEWKFEYPIYESPQFKLCLTGQTKGLNGPSHFMSDKYQEGKLFSLDSDKELTFTPTTDGEFSYVYETGDPLYYEFSEPFSGSKDKSTTVQGKKSESAFIGRVIKVENSNPQNEVTAKFDIPVDDLFVVFRYELSATASDKYNPNMILLMRFENYVPIVDKFDEFAKYYFSILVSEKMIKNDNGKIIIQIPMRRRSGTGTDSPIIVYPMIFQVAPASIMFAEDMPFDAYPSSIAFPGCFRDNNDYDVDTISDNKLNFNTKQIQVFEGYFIYVAIPQTLAANKYKAYHYRSSFVLSQKEFPVWINTSTPKLWRNLGITNKYLTIKCSYCNMLNNSAGSGLKAVSGSNGIFKFGSDQGTKIYLYPICSNDPSKSFCLYQTSFNRNYNNLLRFPNTDGLRHLIQSNTDDDAEPTGFYAKVYKAGDMSNPRWVWKTWEGKPTLIEISYDSSATIKVLKTWYPTKGVNVKLHVNNKQVPVSKKDTQALISLFNNIGCTRFTENTINDPNQVFYEKDGSMTFRDQSVCVSGTPRSYNPSYAYQYSGLLFSSTPHITFEDKNEADPVEPPLPAATAVPERTPVRTPLKFPDDPDFEGVSGSDDAGPSGGKSNKIGIIIGVVVCIVVSMAKSCMVALRFTLPNTCEFDTLQNH